MYDRDTDQLTEIALRITRGVTHTAEDGYVVGPTKSEGASTWSRSLLTSTSTSCVTLHEHVDPDPGALRFGQRRAPPPTSRRPPRDGWYPARQAIGQPEMTFHALRHCSGTAYAQTGATLKETRVRAPGERPCWHAGARQRRRARPGRSRRREGSRSTLGGGDLGFRSTARWTVGSSSKGQQLPPARPERVG